MIDAFLFFVLSVPTSVIMIMMASFYFDKNGGDNKLTSFLMALVVFLYWLAFSLSFGNFQRESEDYVAHLSPDGIPYIQKDGAKPIGTMFYKNISEGTTIRAVRSKRLHSYVDFPFSSWRYEIVEAEHVK